MKVKPFWAIRCVLDISWGDEVHTCLFMLKRQHMTDKSCNDYTQVQFGEPVSSHWAYQQEYGDGGSRQELELDQRSSCNTKNPTPAQGTIHKRYDPESLCTAGRHLDSGRLSPLLFSWSKPPPSPVFYSSYKARRDLPESSKIPLAHTRPFVLLPESQVPSLPSWRECCNSEKIARPPKRLLIQWLITFH